MGYTDHFHSALSFKMSLAPWKQVKQREEEIILSPGFILLQNTLYAPSLLILLSTIPKH